MKNVKKYTYYPYNKLYPDLYKKQRNRLIKIFGDSIRLEHIGSSSVPGLGGKGIIDIELSVSKKEIGETKKILVKNGYKVGDNFNDPERWFFKKFYIDKGKKRTVHIHLTFHNSTAWKRALSTRDYLRENKKAREEYASIKKEGVKVAKGEAHRYRIHKQGFLQKLSKKALKKYYPS